MPVLTRPPGRRSSRPARRERLRLIGEIVAGSDVGSQHEIVERLAERGVSVTQATVSRDIAELGLVKVPGSNGSIYASPEDLGSAPAAASDERLMRVLADYPVRIGRSGLTLLIVSEAGTAGAIGQAIDESTFVEQEGTLAGDNTVLVLFADEDRLESWLDRFGALLGAAPARRSAR